MDISEYDKFLRISDNANSGEWYKPSEFNIIKNPPTKFLTTEGVPSDTSKLLLREPAAFVYWAYLYYNSLSRTVKVYYPLDGTLSDTNTLNGSSGYVDALYRSLNHPSGMVDPYHGYLHNHLYKLVVEELIPGADLYTFTLNAITASELESRYPNYSYVGVDLTTGSPLTSKIVDAVASRAQLARDILNGGFSGYEYQNLTLIGSDTAISITKNCLVTRSITTESISEDEKVQTTTYTITQQADTTTGTLDESAPLLDITVYPSSVQTTAVIYLQLGFSFSPSSGFKKSGRGQFPSLTYPSAPDDVYKTEIHEITFTGSKTITNADVGLGSFNALINRAKSALNSNFFEINSTNYSLSDQDTEYTKYVTKGSAEIGKFTVTVSYYAFLKHKFSIPN